MNKQKLLDQVIEALMLMAERAEQARRASQQDANDHLGRLVSRYDTFKEEAQYLEAAQQHRGAEIAGWIETLRQLIALQPQALGPAQQVRVGALVYIASQAPADRRRLFILPVGAGIETHLGAEPVQILSWRSPMARTMAGLRPGDVFSTPHDSGNIQWVIEQVA